MKRFKNCQSMYQGNSCDCGYDEPAKQRYTPQDEWLHKRRQEINGWQSQVNRLLGVIESLQSETARECACSLLAIAEYNLQKAKQDCGQKLNDVLKTHESLKCPGYHPEHGNCTEIGTMSHLGSDSWFCRQHYLK